MITKIIFLLIFSLLGQMSYAQLKPERSKPQPDTSKITKRASNTISLYQQYILVKEAKKGNVIAQHELGIRYMSGESFPKDAEQGVYWIKKAADNYLPSANYNLGLLYYRGEGVDWNPFKAFQHIKVAADVHMPEAMYLLGLFYLDNLVVEHDFQKAYDFIKAASDSGYQYAADMIKELGEDGVKKLASIYGSDSSQVEYSKDEIFNLYWKILLRELSAQINIKKTDNPKSDIEKIVNDSTSMNNLKGLALAGNSEALLILGMCHEQGILKKDIATALEYYFRAIRLDSKWGYFFFKSLYHNQEEYKETIDEIKRRAVNNDPVAIYDFYCLSGMGLDNSVNKNEAFELLKKAIKFDHLPSMIELGLAYSEGKFGKRDIEKAISILKLAELKGSHEAKVWIARLNIQDNFKYQPEEETIKYLFTASDNGVLYAQVMLAYCYENGIGLEQDNSKAVQMYRTALSRGNQGAASALKRMHDKIRPGEEKFIIKEN